MATSRIYKVLIDSLNPSTVEQIEKLEKAGKKEIAREMRERASMEVNQRIRLVRASSQSAAERFCFKDFVRAKIATQEDICDWLHLGVEDATRAGEKIQEGGGEE